LAQQGYDIVIVGRNQIRGMEICNKLEKQNSIICKFLEADLIQHA